MYRCTNSRNIHTYLAENVDLTSFMKKLREIIDNLYNQEDKDHLNIGDDDTCLIYCLRHIANSTNNIDNSTIEGDNLSTFDYLEGDPYTRGEMKQFSASHAIRIDLWECNIAPDNIDDAIFGCEEFTDFNEVVQFVLTHNLKIHSIQTSCGYFRVEAKNSHLKLRAIDNNSKEDIAKVFRFILKHDSDFRPKRSWRGRKLGEMCANGLKKGVWHAYAYMDENDEIAAYLDYKIRSDGYIDLGAALVNEEYRQQRLASSLIYLFELMFPQSPFFGGTYEENDSMIQTFTTTGFVPRNYYNTETKEKTNRIQERITEAYKESKQDKDLGYSVYFKYKGLFDESLENTRAI